MKRVQGLIFVSILSMLNSHECGHTWQLIKPRKCYSRLYRSSAESMRLLYKVATEFRCLVETTLNGIARRDPPTRAACWGRRHLRRLVYALDSDCIDGDVRRFESRYRCFLFSSGSCEAKLGDHVDSLLDPGKLLAGLHHHSIH